MRIPLASRLLFTFSAVGLALGAHLADISPSHIFNPAWTPHAKFHTGHTLGFSIGLALLTLLFAWRRSDDQRTNVLATAGFASIYWLTQAGAILYPGTAFFDPEFVRSGSYLFGLPGQVFFEMLFLSITALATWLALRRQVDAKAAGAPRPARS